MSGCSGYKFPDAVKDRTLQLRRIDIGVRKFFNDNEVRRIKIRIREYFNDAIIRKPWNKLIKWFFKR